MRLGKTTKLKDLIPSTEFWLRDSRNGRVLIVDDVFGTGSTLHEIIRLITNLNPRLDLQAYTLLDPSDRRNKDGNARRAESRA